MNFLKPDFEKELILTKQYSKVIGIDEVGRGCWAGPTAIGVYKIDLDYEHTDGITDSKKLSELRRDKIFDELEQKNSFKIIFGDVELIDRIGIDKTIEKLIEQAYEQLNNENTFFLIDGQFTNDFGKNVKKIIKGDSKYYSIAAASIVAKVLRDRHMLEKSIEYPGYGFEKHKGYGTKLHKESLEKYGVLDIHRKSYKPIAKYVQ